MTPAGFPHSDIHGSTLESSSPWLFAGFHVLHRLLVPRHPPCALCSLTCCRGASRRPVGPVNHRQMGRVRGSFRHPYSFGSSLSRLVVVAALRLASIPTAPFSNSLPSLSDSARSSPTQAACVRTEINGQPAGCRDSLERLTTLVDGNVLLGSVATCAQDDCALWRPSGGLVRLSRCQVAAPIGRTPLKTGE